MKKMFGALAIALCMASFSAVYAQGKGPVSRTSGGKTQPLRSPGSGKLDASSLIQKIKAEPQYLGKFSLSKDGKMSKITDAPAPMGVVTPWFQSDGSIADEEGFISYFNIGAGGAVSAGEYSFPFTEYQSSGVGATEGTTVEEIRVWFVWPAEQGNLDLDLYVYDGYDVDDIPPNKDPIVAYGLSFDFTGASGAVWFTDIALEEPFDIAGSEFEFGIRLGLNDLGVQNTGATFGPVLQRVEGGLIAGQQSFDVWESWSGPQAPGDLGGQADGLANPPTGGNYWWFGGDPWAGAAFGINPVDAPAPFPESFVIHNDYTGDGENIDLAKVVHKGTGTATDLSLENLTDSAYGITGVGLDRNFASFPPVTLSDFQFHVSPQGAFGELTWTPAPAPTFTLQADSGTDGKDRVIFTWPANTIQNRWLRVTVLFTEATGIPQEYLYVGHLVGEVTGLDGSTYTVSFADLAGIRAGAGATVDASSDLDVDKNGTVSFADISAARPGVGNQLSNISVP